MWRGCSLRRTCGVRTGTAKKKAAGKAAAWVVLGIVAVAAVAICVWIRPNGRDAPVKEAPAKPADSSPPAAPPPAPTALHPLLQQASEVVVAEGSEEVRSTAGPELAEVIRTVLRSGTEAGEPASLTVDYPHDQTIVPPEIVPPTFLWHLR